MSGADALLQEIIAAPSWDERVSLVRTIPERFGTAEHAGIYSELARRLYVPRLTPDFSHVHWAPDYEYGPFAQAYSAAARLTRGFASITVDALSTAIVEVPTTLKVFRTITALGVQEFAASTRMLADDPHTRAVSTNRIKRIEAGGPARPEEARTCALVVIGLMDGSLFGAGQGQLRAKGDRPDTVGGWDAVRQFARDGVPYSMFLHQRHYGGAFRQLLDATSGRRGDILEEAVETLVRGAGVPYLRGNASTRAEMQDRFRLSVRPLPDFVFFDSPSRLRALLECKATNDGGTARDKADRFDTLRTEATRLGGIPVFAVIGGLGWQRAGDALGPVLRATDGRTFTLATLDELLSVEPFPRLRERRETDDA